jgi:WD40 repeat protein
VSEAPFPASPYKGLAPFDDSDVDGLLFFGRERDSEIIAANLLAARLTVLYGTSGVGKSSVLRAGVARRLRSEPHAEVIVFSSWSGETAAPIRAAREAAERGSDVYLILDQFEEYFLYHGREESKETLAEELPELLAADDVRVNVLISVREDALARLDTFKAQIPNVFANYLRLPHLDRTGGRAAIVDPLENWTEVAGEAQRVVAEPALVEAVLDQTARGRVELRGAGPDAGDAGAAGGVETPILQLVLEQLWQTEREQGSRVLRLGTLDALGGAEAIVRGHLERAIDLLDSEEKDIAASLFDHLVTPSGSKIAQRSTDLADYARVGGDKLLPMLATLERARILRSVDGSDDGAARYEIFHDVLADAVLGWRAQRRLERERKAADRRHRRLLAVTVAALLTLALVTALAVFALVQRNRERERTRQAEARALSSRALLELPLGAPDSLALAVRAARLEPGPQTEAVLRQALIESRLRSLLPLGGPVRSLQFSRDGRRLLVAGSDRRIAVYDPWAGRLVRRFRDASPVRVATLGPRRTLVTGDEDGRVQVRRMDSARVVKMLRGRGAVTSLAFGRGGRLLLVTTDGGTAVIWRGRDEMLHVLPQPGPVARGVFDPRGKLVATIAVDADGKARARVFDVRSGKQLHVLPQGNVQDVEFSRDGKLLAAGAHDGTIGLWNPRSGRLLRLLDDGGKDVRDVAFSPDGTLLGAAGGDGGTRVWKVPAGERLFFFPGHTAPIVSVAWSPDGRVLADASLDRTARLFGIAGLVEAGSQIATLPGNAGGTSALAFAPSGARVATGGMGGGVRLWDARAEERLAPLGFHRGPVATAAYSPDGTLAVSAGADGTARIWDVRRRRLLHVLRIRAPVVDARFSPDGTLVATASDGGGAQIWRVSDGASLDHLGGPASLTLARFSPDGDVVATGANDGSLRLWRVSDGHELHTLEVGGPVADAAFTANGKTLATASPRGAALWSVMDGRPEHELPVTGGVLQLDFSPDGRLLATAEARGTATLWDVSSGRPLHLLEGHTLGTSVTDAVFSPDGTTLLTTGSDSDGRTWDVQSGAQVHLLRGQFGSLAAGAFSFDGRWIATAGPISAVLWPAATGRLLFYLRGHTAQVTAVSFSPDSRQLLTASKDGSVRIYTCTVCGDLSSLQATADARLAHSGIRH